MTVNRGNHILIPHITIAPSDTELPFTLKCHQFPLWPCFAMSTNKVQGQTLQFVGIYLPDHVFTHGQLYVAFSRVTDPSALAVCLNNPDGFKRNIVFLEVLCPLHVHFVHNHEISVPPSHSMQSMGWPLVTTIEQNRQGFNESFVAGSVAGHAKAPNHDRLQYPGTPKEFKTFDSLKQLQYNGNMLTPEERSGLYWDCTKVTVEMADAYNVFSRCMYST